MQKNTTELYIYAKINKTKHKSASTQTYDRLFNSRQSSHYNTQNGMSIMDKEFISTQREHMWSLNGLQVLQSILRSQFFKDIYWILKKNVIQFILHGVTK